MAYFVWMCKFGEFVYFIHNHLFITLQEMQIDMCFIVIVIEQIRFVMQITIYFFIFSISLIVFFFCISNFSDPTLSIRI